MEKNVRKSKLLDYKNIALLKLLVALIALVLTSLSISATGDIGNIKKLYLPMNSLYKMPDTLVFLIFGLLHTFTVCNEYENCKTLNFISDWLLYTAFYNLVLLPACGFGFFEWIILGGTFLFELGIISQRKIIQRKISTKIIVSDIDSLLIFGIFLFLFKLIVRYMFKTNLSPDILENNSAMNLITILIALLAVYGLKSAVTGLKLTKEVSKTGDVVVKTTKKVSLVIFKFFSKIIHFIINLVLTLVTNPIVLLIIVGAVFLLGVVGVITVLWKINDTLKDISTDIKQFIAPIIRFALGTDNAAYSDDKLNTLGMIGAFIIIMGIKFFEKNKTSEIEKIDQAETKLIEEKRNETIDMFFGNQNRVKKE